jgi:hypothetical protein
MNNYTFIKSDEDFHSARSATIGSSDIPVILGLSKFKTPYQLWLEMTGREEDSGGSEAALMGHMHEPTILTRHIQDLADMSTASKFRMDYFKSMANPNKYKFRTDYIPFTRFKPSEKELSFALAHPDCVDIQNNIIIEAKSGGFFAMKRREEMPDGYDPKDETANGLPLSAYLQTLWQSMCSGIDEIHVRALFDTSQWSVHKFKANRKHVGQIIEHASRFMWHVKNDTPIKPMNYEDVKKMFPVVEETVAYVSGFRAIDAITVANRRKRLKKLEKSTRDELRDCDNALALLLGDNQSLRDGEDNQIAGQTMYTKKLVKSPSDIKKADPELYEKMLKAGLIYETNVRFVRV